MSFTLPDQTEWSDGRIHPLLRHSAEKRRTLFIRLLAYLCGVVLLAQITTDLLDPDQILSVRALDPQILGTQAEAAIDQAP